MGRAGGLSWCWWSIGVSRVLRWWWAGVRAMWVEIPLSLWVNAVWAARRVGYVVRPYDMLADARRWWWQPQQRCRFSMGGLILPGRPAVSSADEEVIRISPATEVVSRDLADRLGIAAAWDDQRRREQGGGIGGQ